MEEGDIASDYQTTTRRLIQAFIQCEYNKALTAVPCEKNATTDCVKSVKVSCKQLINKQMAPHQRSGNQTHLHSQLLFSLITTC